jgi:hypothetical protein
MEPLALNWANERSVRNTAAHEAAHAVVAAALGIRVVKIELDIDNATGACYHAKSTPLDYATISLAGPVSHKILRDKRANDKRYGSDRYQARFAIARHIHDRPTIGYYLRLAETRARALLREHEGAWRALTHRLLSTSGPDLHTVLRTHGLSR